MGHTAVSDGEAFHTHSSQHLLNLEAWLEDQNQTETEDEEENTAELNEAAGLWGETEMRDAEDFIERVLQEATKKERPARRKGRGRVGRKQ